jgi:hypothetical protein
MTGSEVTDGYTERIGGTIMVNLQGRFTVGDEVAISYLEDMPLTILWFLTTKNGEDWAVCQNDGNESQRPLVVAAKDLTHRSPSKKFEVGKYYAEKKNFKDGVAASAYKVVHITEKGTVFMVSSTSEEYNYEITYVTTSGARENWFETRLLSSGWKPVR